MTLACSRQLLMAAAVCLGITLLVAMGGLTVLAQAGKSSLEAVGHLISNVQHISLDRLDPTCPQCL